MKKPPFVTIGIPTYNSEQYLKHCLDSILKQTYSDFEIIVSDNGSTDNTEKIVFSYNDTRIKFNKNSYNLGCYGNYNRIISLAKGELIAFYHSDDTYDSYIVEKEVEFLQKHSDAAAVFTEAYLINAGGSIIGELISPEKFSKKEILDFNKAYGGFLAYGDFLICPSAMFIKKTFSETGIFKEEKFQTASDLEMWLRILQKYPIGILHEKLMFYRIHQEQGSFMNPTDEADYFCVIEQYSSYALEKESIPKISWDKYKTRKALDIFYKGQSALINKNFREAKAFFLQFLQLSNLFLLLSHGKAIELIILAILSVCSFYLGLGMLFQKLAKHQQRKKRKRKLKRIE